ncbi:MAG TPA: gliding motility-associated C-terminal domain-containing protein [Prolixibacteraceae bacterium]|nr:gliding motility-associated C-terminal domain-containing protein [Prolixibacteraceae bacterium]
MKIQSIVAGLIVLTIFVLAPSLGFAQISSNANQIIPTEYSSGGQDNIHIFCTTRDAVNASLTATSPTGVGATYEWLRYNAQTGAFEPYQSDLLGAATSVISNLADGAYRVNITAGAEVQTFTAWVFNNYIETTAAITNSDCNSFTLVGTSDTPALTYVDLPTGQLRQLDKGVQIRWTTANNEPVGEFLTYQVFSPPTKDTEYILTVTDRFGCSSQARVMYESIVTKASFTYEEVDPKSHPSKTEAPLTVIFTNTSENGDPNKFQWFIFKDRNVLAQEGQAANGQPIDSILTKIFTDSPTYIFEKPGTYNVKLVSQKESASGICYDTVYIDQFISIDTSFIEAPTFFTPGGDGANDRYVVRFFSMQSVKLSIFNRWGKVVHVWESDNVRGFGPTVESTPQAVWDGKVGGKMATPGVYYYVAEGRGRDDKRQRANGFFHLFREK